MLKVKAPTDAVRKAIIYQIHLRAFTKEGTLKAAEQYLDDVAATGADIVYLCPIVMSDDHPNRAYWSERQKRSGIDNPRNPYRQMDYFAIDPEYGTEEDVHSFIKAAHDRNLKVMFDLVYMHAGPTFGMKYPQYVKQNKDGTPKLNEYNFCTIDFDKPELREYLWKNMLYFVEKFGIDAYRCDVGGCVPLDFWEEGVRRIKAIRPDFIMLNEFELPYRPEDQVYAFDINYSQAFLQQTMQLIFAYEAPVSDLENAWNKEHSKCEGGMVLRGIEHHDTANDNYYGRVEKFSHEKCEAAYVLCYCMEGVPFLYNGCEYKDSNRHSIFSLKGTYCIDRSIDPAERCAFFQKLAKLHRTEPALLYGNTEFLHHESMDDICAIARTTEDGAQAICLVNLGRGTKTFTHDILENYVGEKLVMSRGMTRCNNTIILEQYGYAVLIKQ